jgi:predicted phosphodiesterase
MVKIFKRYLLLFLYLASCLFINCNNDILGLFASTDLDERLNEKNPLKFMKTNNMRLLPLGHLGDEYSFIVITDTHIENGNAFGLEKIIPLIANDRDIKFVVINGDITQNGNKENIAKFIEIAHALEDLGVPCYPVIGNHDIYFNNWPNWKAYIGSTYYRIDSGKTTLFFLDSANAYFGKTQLDWLESGIKTAGRRVFVFSHVNLFVKSPFDIQQFTDVRERARIISILKGRCDIMFMGHVHKRILNEAGGVKFLSIEDYRDNRIFCRVNVKNTGIDFSFHKL